MGLNVHTSKPACACTRRAQTSGNMGRTDTGPIHWNFPVSLYCASHSPQDRVSATCGQVADVCTWMHLFNPFRNGCYTGLNCQPDYGLRQAFGLKFWSLRYFRKPSKPFTIIKCISRTQGKERGLFEGIQYGSRVIEFLCFPLVFMVCLS